MSRVKWLVFIQTDTLWRPCLDSNSAFQSSKKEVYTFINQYYVLILNMYLNCNWTLKSHLLSNFNFLFGKIIEFDLQVYILSIPRTKFWCSAGNGQLPYTWCKEGSFSSSRQYVYMCSQSKLAKCIWGNKHRYIGICKHVFLLLWMWGKALFTFLLYIYIYLFWRTYVDTMVYRNT